MEGFPFPGIRARKITLLVDAGELRVKAPKGSMTPAILEAIRQHRAGLIELLSIPGVSDCLRCAASSWWSCDRIVEPGFYCFSYALFPPVRSGKPGLCIDRVGNCKHRRKR
jgi:hypothetical protein